MITDFDGESIKSPEEYFKLGADAMQGRIVTLLVMKGHMDLASQVLELQSPPFSEPEVVTVSSKDEGGANG